jgi:ankyrin repeat protein
MLIPDVLNHLLPHLTKEVVESTNNNGSPAIHWAVFNNQIGCVKALVEAPQEIGGGLPVLKVRRFASSSARLIPSLLSLLSLLSPSEPSCQRRKSKLTLQQKNRAGRDAFAEAIFAGEGKEEVAGYIEGYLWRAEGGGDEELEPSSGDKTDKDGEEEEEGEDGEIRIRIGDDVAKDEAEVVDELAEKTDEVKI